MSISKHPLSGEPNARHPPSPNHMQHHRFSPEQTEFPAASLRVSPPSSRGFAPRRTRVCVVVHVWTVPVRRDSRCTTLGPPLLPAIVAPLAPVQPDGHLLQQRVQVERPGQHVDPALLQQLLVRLQFPDRRRADDQWDRIRVRVQRQALQDRPARLLPIALAYAGGAQSLMPHVENVGERELMVDIQTVGQAGIERRDDLGLASS